MKQKIKKLSKTMAALIIAFSILLISLIGLTVAYFTDNKSFTGTLEFGNIELSVSQNDTELSNSFDFDVARKDSTWTGKVMPGDVINIAFKVALKEQSDPAYYLVFLNDSTGVFESGIAYFSDGTNVYVNDGTKTYLQSDSSKSEVVNKHVGTLVVGQSHQFTIGATIPTDYEIQNTKTEVFLNIYAIQQANLKDYSVDTGVENAYTKLMKMNEENEKGVTLLGGGAIDRNNQTLTTPLWQSVVNYKNLKKVGFYNEGNQPDTLTISKLLTYQYDDLVTNEDDKGKIDIYTNGTDEVAFVSKYKIMAPEDSTCLFAVDYAGGPSVRQLELSNFYTNNVTIMNDMFRNCYFIESLDVSKFNTSKVTNMEYTFWGCSDLLSLDLSSFDTSNVTNMRQLFTGCNALASLNISSFNTSKVTNMGAVFSGCEALTTLNLEHFDTSNVTNMGSMFYGMNSLVSLNLKNFNTSKVEDMQMMFCGDKFLTTIDVSSFNTSNVTNMRGMFMQCSGLTSLDLSNFDTTSVTSSKLLMMFSQAFNNAGTLTISENFVFDGAQATKAIFKSKTLLSDKVVIMRSGAEVTA